MDQILQAGQQFLSNQGQQGGNTQQGGGGFDIGQIGNLISHAQDHDQTNSGNQELFGKVAGLLQNQSGNLNGDIDENALLQSHDKVNNQGGNVGSGDIGNAAALSAIKSVLGGSGGNSGGGDMQQKLIGAAMAHAGSLFDQKQGQGQAQGNKEDAMQQAGQAVMKLMIKNQVSGMIGGGNSGGLSQLAKLVM